MTNLLKNSNFYLKGILLLFVASTLAACDEQTIFHSYQPLPIEGWKKKDTLSFNVEVPDSFTHYKLSVAIRNRNNYPYQNINLSISYIAPTDTCTSYLPADTIQLILADKEGKWKGTGWGSLYQSEFPVGGIKIAKPGKYQFKIAYTFPDQKLNGINDIGIKLNR